MKVVGVIALLVVAATAQNSKPFNNPTSGVAYIGYPNRASLDKANAGSIWGAFPVGTNIRPNIVPGDGYSACMIVTATLSSANADSTASFCAQPYTGTPADPSGSTATCANMFTLSNKSPGMTNQGVYDFTPNTNGTTGGYVWPDGIAVGATVTKCTTCVSTSDWVVSALAGYTFYTCTLSNIPFSHWAPVVAVDDINTFTFPVTSTGYPPVYGGAPYSLMLDPVKQGSLPVFALATPSDKTTAKMHLVFTTAAASTKPYPDLTSTTNWPSDPTTWTVAKQNFNTGPVVAPLGQATPGPFRTGSLSLTAATTGNAWFVAPYVDAGTSWTVAIGYGHEPSAAGVVAPSLLLAAIFAMIAMLF
jgi:hypothetical protein